MSDETDAARQSGRQQGPDDAAPRRASADWLREAGWGVFTHYLADTASAREAPALTPDDWNRQVDAFDVEALAGQLAAVDAKYYGITIGQNSGFYCSLNDTYDGIVGRDPSRLSSRDLVSNIADALAPKDTRLIAYLPAHAPENDEKAREAFGWRRPKEMYTGGERFADMQEKWESVVREWSERWGPRVSGWWIDGCYWPDAMYRHPDPPNFASFKAALQAGNPDALVAFNPGVRIPRVVSMAGSDEEYTAGEIDFALPAGGRWYGGETIWPDRPVPGHVMPPHLVDGAQFHILSFLGESWGRGEGAAGVLEEDHDAGMPRFPDQLVVAYTKYVTSHGGAITWDAPILRDGLIPVQFVAQLLKLREATA